VATVSILKEPKLYTEFLMLYFSTTAATTRINIRGG
jgi:hypothetical protein